jgi:hypothetical protein
MHRPPSPLHLGLPREIVISDEHGVVDRIQTGPQALERDLSQGMLRELMQQNADLRAQLEATKKKWYVITAGIATTTIPLVICGIELYGAINKNE